MLTRNRNLTEGFFISLLPPHNSYKDEQTNHHDDNYFCHKIKTTLFPAGTLSANTGQKNVWATCWRCFYQLSSSTNSVTIIHQFFLRIHFDAKMFNLSQVCVMAHMDWDFQAYLPVISCMEVFDDNREATIFERYFPVFLTPA